MASSILQSIANKASSEEQLVSAINQLGPVTESPRFWIAIAEDPTYPRSHRRHSIFQLFKRHVKPGMTLASLGQLLGQPAWLAEQDITMVEDLGGSIPVRLSFDNTVLVLAILPDSAPHTDRWQIYLSVQGHVDLGEVWQVLQGRETNSATGATPILEVGFSPPI